MGNVSGKKSSTTSAESTDFRNILDVVCTPKGVSQFKFYIFSENAQRPLSTNHYFSSDVLTLNPLVPRVQKIKIRNLKLI